MKSEICFAEMLDQYLPSHISHIDNLASIIEQDCLWSVKKHIELGLTNQYIGYNHIKQRRLIRPVNVAAGGTIGQ